MHLTDGIVFGRHRNTRLQLQRPTVRIPPRKQTDVELDEDDYQLAIEDGAHDYTEGASQAADPDTTGSDEGDGAGDGDSESDDASYREESDDSDQSTCTSEDSDLGDAGEDGISKHEPGDASNVVGLVTAPVTDESQSPWQGFDDHEASTSSSTSSTSSSSDPSSDDTSSASSSSSSSSTTDDSSEDEVNKDDGSATREILRSADEPLQALQAPFTGKLKTQQRNQRRMLGKKLRYMKSEGLLPETAQLSDIQEHLGQSDQTARDARHENQILGTGAITGVAKTSKTYNLHEDDVTAALEQKRQQLLAALATGGVDAEKSAPAGMPDPQPDLDDRPEVITSKRRAKIDVEGSRRLLFGSLGVRAPKTEAERQKLQEKLASQALRKPVDRSIQKEVMTETDEPQRDPDDPEFWRSRIHLSAVECCPEESHIKLSTPPFPFYQRWDASQQGSKKRKRNDAMYNESNAKRIQYDPDAEYDDEEYDDEALDYDEHEEHVYDDIGVSEAKDESDDWPRVPQDTASLALLKAPEAMTGQIIIFQQLEVSTETGWQPALSQIKTAQILNVAENQGNPELQLRLAKRDLPSIEYDEYGEQIYGKFDMPNDDDETDPALVTLAFADLVGPRVLQEASAGADHVTQDA